MNQKNLTTNTVLMLPLEEISKMYSINKKTLRRWASERRFPLYKISNRIRVSPDEFERWLGQFHIQGTHKDV